jgi:hypothetical protein
MADNPKIEVKIQNVYVCISHWFTEHSVPICCQSAYSQDDWLRDNEAISDNLLGISYQ